MSRPGANDPIGSIAWTERTVGALTARECLTLARPLLRGELSILAGRLAMALRMHSGRRSSIDPASLVPPDSALARDAGVAAQDLLTPALRNHSGRAYTWGAAIAALHGITFDRELLYLAAMFHDTGIPSPVPDGAGASGAQWVLGPRTGPGSDRRETYTFPTGAQRDWPIVRWKEGNWRWMVLAVVAVVALPGCSVGGESGQSTTAGSTGESGDVAPPHPTVAALVDRVRSGVVRIEADDCSGGATGTGFLVGRHLVATVEHVVDNAQSIALKQHGDTVAGATVIGRDAARDVALLRTSAPLGGHIFRLAKREARLGESVAALGFPLGLPLSLTKGSVSGTKSEGPDR